MSRTILFWETASSKVIQLVWNNGVTLKLVTYVFIENEPEEIIKMLLFKHSSYTGGYGLGFNRSRVKKLGIMSLQFKIGALILATNGIGLYLKSQCLNVYWK